jgi:hypothetical protein
MFTWCNLRQEVHNSYVTCYSRVLASSLNMLCYPENIELYVLYSVLKYSLLWSSVILHRLLPNFEDSRKTTENNKHSFFSQRIQPTQHSSFIIVVISGLFLIFKSHTVQDDKVVTRSVLRNYPMRISTGLLMITSPWNRQTYLQDFRFSQRWLWRVYLMGYNGAVVGWLSTDYTVSFSRITLQKDLHIISFNSRFRPCSTYIYIYMPPGICVCRT